ncbi:hypothetical protein H6H00_17210 [Pseudonocardia petroleophila]|uniref:Uncharacterized protein n=1 Tax=Pseudonocardia petroleophila TaxID=37331 RepID=A0A7G7MB52_9PSEU|nr:hypothetical protein [Pseudonocardia petroleophila]QNG50013.1 hypothetical protein H6H00_17210 [Pseudonocardia petroleophila]
MPRLLGGVLSRQLEEDVPSVAAPCIRETAQFDHVPPLPRQLDQYVDRVAAAGVGESAQLVQVGTFRCQLDQLVLRITITTSRSLTQPIEITGHCNTPPDPADHPSHSPHVVRPAEPPDVVGRCRRPRPLPGRVDDGTAGVPVR